jgi:hypothetical protein
VVLSAVSPEVPRQPMARAAQSTTGRYAVREGIRFGIG